MKYKSKHISGRCVLLGPFKRWDCEDLTQRSVQIQ